MPRSGEPIIQAAENKMLKAPSCNRPSLNADMRRGDHSAPQFQFVGEELRRLLRCGGAGIELELMQPFAYLRILEDFDGVAVDLGDERRRRAGRCGQREPGDG